MPKKKKEKTETNDEQVLGSDIPHDWTSCKRGSRAVQCYVMQLRGCLTPKTKQTKQRAGHWWTAWVGSQGLRPTIRQAPAEDHSPKPH